MREVYYTPEQVAERLGLHPNTIRLWLRQGAMPGVRIGRLWRVRESDLEAYAESRRNVPREGGEHESSSTE